MTLLLNGPYRWEDILEGDVAEKSGIYIWAVPVDGTSLIYYVGETKRPFRIRFQEHTIGFYQ